MWATTSSAIVQARVSCQGLISWASSGFLATKLGSGSTPNNTMGKPAAEL